MPEFADDVEKYVKCYARCTAEDVEDKTTRRRSSQRVTVSLDSYPRTTEVPTKGFQWVLEGDLRELRAWDKRTREYARLCRTSVRIQSTDESPYN